jgi:hypothetical protein
MPMKSVLSMIFVGTLGLSPSALSASLLSAATPAPKAYLANITDVTNPEKLKEYQKQARGVWRPSVGTG